MNNGKDFFGCLVICVTMTYVIDMNEANIFVSRYFKTGLLSKIVLRERGGSKNYGYM